MKWQFTKLIVLLVLLSAGLYFGFSQLIHLNEKESGRYYLAVDELISPDNDISRITVLSDQDIYFPESLNRELQSGATIRVKLASDTYAYYRRLNDEQLLSIAPVHETHTADTWLFYAVIAFYLGLIAIALSLIWPVFRDLYHLQTQAVAFGKEPKPMSLGVKESSPIAPLAKTFSRMSKQVVGLVSVHKMLSQIISHEVRTPLARLRFGLSLVDSNSADEPRFKQMKRDIDEIEELATSYLTFARLDYLRKSRQNEIVLSDFMTGLKENYAVFDDKFAFIFEHDGEVIYGDEQALRIICQNLLSNSMRYAESVVALTVKVEKDGFEIKVEDDGCGFPEGFDPFKKFEQSHIQPSGFGLGLFLVKQITDWLGGAITASTSKQYGGASVKISFLSTAAHSSA